MGKYNHWMFQHGFDPLPGDTRCYDDSRVPWRYMPWTSRWVRFRNRFGWAKRVLRQILCWHGHSHHSGSGRVELTLVEAKNKFDKLTVNTWHYGVTIPAIRVNHACNRCGRGLRPIYTMDIEKFGKLIHEAAEVERLRYGALVADPR